MIVVSIFICRYMCLFVCLRISQRQLSVGRVCTIAPLFSLYKDWLTRQTIRRGQVLTTTTPTTALAPLAISGTTDGKSKCEKKMTQHHGICNVCTVCVSYTV